MFVRIPPSFFKKAKLEYSDWRFAFFREIIQNSVDACATQISFEFESKPSGLVIRARDNGLGMDPEVIEDTFLALGESLKLDDSIGGFGMAKNIILLAHSSWSIRSRYCRYAGWGGTYERQPDHDEYLQGVELEISMDVEDSQPSVMETALRRLVANSSIKARGTAFPVTIYFQGNILARETETLPYEKSFDLGNLLFGESSIATSHSLWVRVQGIPMFEYRLWSRSSKVFRAFLDLHSGQSVLTINRDGLLEGPQRSLNELIHKLSEDLTTLKQGTLQFQITLNPTDGVAQALPSDIDESLAEDLEASLDKLSKLRYRLRNRLKDPAFPENFEIQVRSIGLKRTTDGQTTSIRDVRKVLVHSMNKKLATAWMAACKTLLTLPIFSTRVSYDTFRLIPVITSDEDLGFEVNTPFTCMGKSVYFGFVFDSATEASCVVDSASITLFVNPTIFTASLPWRGKANMPNLMDLAYHEVSHILEANHSADFCSVEVELRRQFRVRFTDRAVHSAAHRAFRDRLGSNVTLKGDEDD